MKYVLFIILTILTIISCKQHKLKQILEWQSCCSFKTDSVLLDNQFPFDTSKIVFSDIIKLFKEPIDIDSCVNLDSKARSVKYFCSNKNSKIDFLLVNYISGKQDFIIGDFSISSDLIELKNGIKINMLKNDFLKILNIKDEKCDSILYYEGQFPIHTYKFIFKDNKLVFMSRQFSRNM